MAVATVTCSLALWLLTPSPPVNKTVARLIEQASGQHTYWSADGREMTWSYLSRHEGCERLYAIEELWHMGARAQEALPFLRAQLASGIENIDTGDGVIRLRDAVEKAIDYIERSDK